MKTNFPILETKRLILRAISEEDLIPLFNIRSNEENMRYIPRPVFKIKEEALVHIHTIQKAYETQEGINWVITFKEKNELLGLIGFVRRNIENYRAEVGYILSEKQHQKGIMTEAMQAVIAYGFEHMQLNSIHAIIDPENVASQRVLEKSNFSKEGYFRQDTYFNGKFLDSIHYSLLKNEHRPNGN